MILGIIFLLISITLASLVYYFLNLYEIWYYFFVPILCIPLFYIVIFLIYILIIFLISICISKKKDVSHRPSKLWHFWIKETAYQLLFMSRTRVKVIGKSLIDPKKNYLVVSNHLSMFDPMITINKLGIKHLVCVSKKENLDFPICGAFIYKAGYIFLDREDNHAAIQSIRQASEYLNNQWSSIYICPEGTRSKTGKLLPFHPGSFKIATKAEVDIVVCYIQNTNQVLHRFPFRSTKVTLKVLKVIPKEEVVLKKTVELSQDIYELMKKEEEK